MLHLNEKQVAQIEKLINLLDEGFFKGVGDQLLHQQADGNVEIVISLGNTLDRQRGTSKIETTIVVNQSMITEGVLRHYYADLDEAIESIGAWHSKLFEIPEDVRVSETTAKLRLVK